MTARKTGLTRRNPAEFGTVEQRPNGRFRAYFRSEGVVHRAPSTFATRADARAWLGKQEAALRGGVFIAPTAGAGTLGEFAREWLDDRRADLSPRTVENYSRALSRWILPTLGTLRLDQITPTRVRSWRSECLALAAADAAGVQEVSGSPVRAWAVAQGLPVAPTGRLPRAITDAWEQAGSPHPGKRRRAGDGSAAVAYAYGTLRAILATAEREDVIARNPCRLTGAGSTRAVERTPATPEQVVAIAAAMPERYQAAVTLAAWTALRSGEIRALARRHVDLDAGTVRIERAVIEVTGEPYGFGPPKTASSRRTVAVPGFVLAALREHMAAHVAPGPEALIFATSDGGILGRAWLGAAFRRAQRRAGFEDLGLRFHDLRHSAASLAYSVGAGAPDVQRMLGHSTMRAAAIYAHAFEGADHAIAARLDAAFAPTPR